MTYRPTIESNPKQEDIDLLGKGIDEYNIITTGITGNTNLTCLVRDDQANVVGGVHGNYNQSGWLYIHGIWVAEEYRSTGMGAALLTCIEKEARKNGCLHSYLNTIEFQAPQFYIKMGYRVFATLENFHQGFRKYFFQKDLM